MGNKVTEIIFGNKNDKKNKCSFFLNEAIQNVLYIPNIGINYINKEFLVDNNFKTCLLKTELYSSIIREFEIYSFFANIISKIKDIISKSPEFNLQKDEMMNKKKKFGELIKKFSNIKVIFEKINKIANKYKKENESLRAKIRELTLFIAKLKKEFDDKTKQFKEKMRNIDDKYNLYINVLEEKNKKLRKSYDKQISLEDKNKDEISNLYLENDKIKNMNLNLHQSINEKDEIINKLKNENEKLLTKLNNFRTNPNAENNIKYYKTFSLNYNKKKQQENRNIMNLSELSNYNYKYKSNKFSNSNDNYLDFSLNENLSNNSMKYSTKENSKHNTKKKKIRNIIKNINELNTNIFNENDISNKFSNSNSNNFNFLNLKIENQENFYFIPDKIIDNFQKEIKNTLEDKNNYTANFQISSNSLEKELLNNIFLIINDFKRDLGEEAFINLTNKNFKNVKIIQLLCKKIEELKINLSNIKEKFKNNHKDKKIKPFQLIDIMDQVEKLLLYVNNHLNKTKNEMQNIQPYLKNIFDFVSKLAYDSPLLNYNNSFEITSITSRNNTLQNSLIINNNPKKSMKDNFLKKNYSSSNIIHNKIINQEIEDINKINNSNETKESLFPNIQELKQFFVINTKIFSSSELIKYKTIYEGLPISKLLNIFKDICQNLKKTISDTKYEYDSDFSDLEESNIIEEIKNSQIISENCSYHLVNQKIYGLKKFEFYYKIFMELLKNYLVTFEIIVNEIEIEINNKNREKQVKLGEELNILYKIFEEAAYFKMDILDDDIIFNRKILLRLLLNHKEYISIIYDI